MGKKFIFSRRRLIQLISAILYNINFKGFTEGRIYQGTAKGVCVPGLNCYSCPGAVASCPLGSLQSSFTNIGTKWPLYILGTLMLFGAAFGRAVCAFLCPFGLIQELLHKIPTPKIPKNAWTRRLSLLKYVVLLLFVILLPLYTRMQNGVAVPAFCKYICPAGTLEGGLPLVAVNSSLREITGFLFQWKILVMLAVIAASIFIYRFFCRFLCPLGAIYSFFNRHALFGIQLEQEKCTHCSCCTRSCKLDVHQVNDRECIRCGECRHVCRYNALNFSSVIKSKRKEETKDALE